MRQRIMQGWPFTPEEQGLILKYCMTDVDALCAFAAANFGGDRAVISASRFITASSPPCLP